MRRIVYIPPYLRVNLLIRLDELSLSLFFDSEREVVVIKKKPLVNLYRRISERKWLLLKGPFVRGGFKVFRAGDGVWERRLPYGLIRVRKHNDCYTVEAKGYHVFVPMEGRREEVRPATSGEIPPVKDWWILRVYEHSLTSLKCQAHLSVISLSGNVHTVCASTADSVASHEACAVFIKNHTVYEVTRENGWYSGGCSYEEEVWELVIDVENDNVRIRDIPAKDKVHIIETRDDEII